MNLTRLWVGCDDDSLLDQARRFSTSETDAGGSNAASSPSPQLAPAFGLGHLFLFVLALIALVWLAPYLVAGFGWLLEVTR